MCTYVESKTLDIRRLCTDRRQDVAVIFLFGLDALFTRDSRAHSSVVLSLPQLLAAVLDPVKPESRCHLSTVGGLETETLCKKEFKNKKIRYLFNSR